MTQIKILEKTCFSHDGIKVTYYKKDQIVDASERMTEVFFNLGVAELYQEKAIEQMPENKAFKTEIENKSQKQNRGRKAKR
jgi:hypothetical protein